MESSIVRGEERLSQPPALPTKQRRSHYSSASSGDLERSEDGVGSPPWTQHQGSTYSDVFSEPTDCHASQCPIHQRYDPSSHHQERFFSEDTPPPVPKKRLARTLSLPGACEHPTSSLWTPSPSLSNQPYNFDNPLYMQTITQNYLPHAETEEERQAQTASLPPQPFADLSFDTLDKDLTQFFSCIDDQADISKGIQHCHLLFLRCKTQSLESRVLLRGEARENVVGLFRPQDLMLSGDCKPKQIGGDIYYAVHIPQLQQKMLAAKVNKTPFTPLVGSTHLPLHVNIQQVIVHFTPEAIILNQQTAFQTEENCFITISSQSNPGATKQPERGSIEPDKSRDDSADSKEPSVLSLLQNGYTVTIERDLPQATLKDFVEESQLLPGSEPLLYERQLCTLLLQLVAGLRHLLSHAAPSLPLKPQDIFLVWPRWGGEETASGLETGIKEKEDAEGGLLLSCTIPGLLEKDMQWERQQKTEGNVQRLWRKWGSPRVVLSHQSTTLSSPHHPPTSILSHLQVVLQYCLQPVEGNQSSRLASSLYVQGLLQLSSVLQDKTTEVKLEDMTVILQAILWGPQAALFTPNGPALNFSNTINNWLSIKRALMVLKLAERALVPNQSGLHWEDYLVLQYLSFTDSETVKKALTQLGLHKASNI